MKLTKRIKQQIIQTNLSYFILLKKEKCTLKKIHLQQQQKTDEMYSCLTFDLNKKRTNITCQPTNKSKHIKRFI